MAFKSQATKDAQKKINKEKSTEMKTPKKTIIITVVLTLTAVATIAGLIYAGFVMGTEYQKGINGEVVTQVKELAVLKENQ